MRAWTLPAWRNGEMVSLSEVLSVVSKPESFDLVVSGDFEATGTPEAMEAAARIYQAADGGSVVPFSLIKSLAERRGQVFDGFLAARAPGTGDAVFRIVSIRGDEWDIESDLPAISSAIERLPGVVPRPD